MKYIYKTLVSVAIGLLGFTSCVDLDLNPLDQASSGNWFTTETQVKTAVNNLYNNYFWYNDDDSYTDDWMYRTSLSAVTSGTINSQWSDAETIWYYTYTAIARANVIIENMDKARAHGVLESVVVQAEAEAKFVRAAQYAYLISRFGDVIDIRKSFTLDEFNKMKRTDKSELIPKVYEDFDYAIANLPTSYNGEKHATKGAAMALKARFALYMGDWATAETSAKACMDLNVYTLASSYRTYFLQSTKNNAESVFLLPRSIANSVFLAAESYTKNYVSRMVSGYAAFTPSWDLFASFLCTDGLPIDESPLFNSKTPFKNRDPRCTQTIVEFGTEWLGYYAYQPHPDSVKVYNSYYKKYYTNNDTRAVHQYASPNGLVWRKGIDNTWYSNGYRIEPDNIIIRYADILLIYAEAKIEQNSIDQSVLDAMNKVRARAYGISNIATSGYPKITTTDQTALRKTLRIERRMEFANEGLRYMDIIRWKLAEKVLNQPNYGNLFPMSNINRNDWFWPQTPSIDDDGVADFSAMYSAGKIEKITQRVFDKSKQYLFPIPSKDMLINPNLVQNPNY